MRKPSIITMQRIDELVLNSVGKRSAIVDPLSYMMMIAKDLCTPLEQIWRVKLLDNDEIELSDFTLARREKNFISTRCLNKADVPKWIVDKISVLQIIPNGEQIDGVGQKVSDQVFYVIE
jgi:hypothetical protein